MNKITTIAICLTYAALMSACMDATPTIPNNDETTNNTPKTDCIEHGSIISGQLNNDAKAYLLCLHNKARSDVALGLVPSAEGNLRYASTRLG